MKVHCQKEDLGYALSSLSHIIPARTNFPILNGILLFTSDDSLVLQSTDLELSLTVKIPVTVEEEGCTVVQGRYLTELVRRIPDTELELNWDEATQQLEAIYGRAQVQLNTWPASDYPNIQAKAEANKIAFSGEKWKKMIKKVLFATAAQDIRPNYAGVFFQIKEGNLHLVATDSYRLALIKTSYTGEITEQSLLIPNRALGEVNRLVTDQDQVVISWDDNSISFSTDQITLTTRLLANEFPHYEKVVPKESLLRIGLDKDQLLSSLERASLFVAPTENFAIVDLNVNGSLLSLSARAVDVGALKEEIPLNEEAETVCEASFNTKFLLEPLRVIDTDQLTICLNGPSGPAIYLEEGEVFYLHLVLPVCRVSET